MFIRRRSCRSAKSAERVAGGDWGGECQEEEERGRGEGTQGRGKKRLIKEETEGLWKVKA